MSHSLKLSKTNIEAFVGEVLPLRITCDEARPNEEVLWNSVGDSVSVKSFTDSSDAPFSDGVLITAVSVGESTVCATIGDITLTATVTVRESKSSTDGELGYYFADLHIHTSLIHDRTKFIERNEAGARGMIDEVNKDGMLDLTVISDHAELVCDREFFDNFIAAEESGDAIVLAGAESEITFVEHDRYGIPIRKSGEIVTLNADNYAFCDNWPEFYAKIATRPRPISVLAHPQVIGYSTPGIWNFALNENCTPEMIHTVRGVEMGNGSLRQSNLINEFIYSLALDNGFKVSTTCSSDSHGPTWGFGACPGKTVVMATERSKAAFIDALDNCRFYATESGNIKLSYSVNGVSAPATLARSDEYTFDVKASCFRDDKASIPISCQVISDGGKSIKTLMGEDLSDLTFTVAAPGAHYFYLRFTDSMQRRTWSPPIFIDSPVENACAPSITPIDKSGFTAYETESGIDASALVSDDPKTPWETEKSSASITVDMGRVTKIAALGHYPRPISWELISSLEVEPSSLLAELPLEFSIESSLDGNVFSELKTGLFRAFGGEEIIHFTEQEARYVRLNILSNVASYNGGEAFLGTGLSVGEITLFKKA